MSKLIYVNQKSNYLAEVVLNRPDKLNAMTKPMWIELGKVFKKLSKDKKLRCIIIRGEGRKSFSPGNDIGEFKKERSSSKLAKDYGKYFRDSKKSIFKRRTSFFRKKNRPFEEMCCTNWNTSR